MKRKLIVILATLAATAGLGTAAIITGTSIFNVSNTAGETGPFGKLVVTLNTSTQVATLDFLPNTSKGFFEIDGSAAGANFSQPVNDFALLGGALELSSGEFKDVSSGNVNGFGDFNFLIDNHDAATLIPEIKFSVHDNGVPWTTIQSIFSFTSGAEPADAVMHINFGDGNTGFTAQTGPFVTSVPDGGATIGLLGLALAAIGFVRRKFGV
jgi:hypothetical protein